MADVIVNCAVCQQFNKRTLLGKPVPRRSDTERPGRRSWRLLMSMKITLFGYFVPASTVHVFCIAVLLYCVNN